MEWVKLAAVPAYYVDGALLRAGEPAEVLFCRGLAHCGGVESKGLIDKTVLPLLVQTRAQTRADALVREGLWIDEGTHYRIRSWDKWQDQHDIAAEKKAKDRERKRDERRRKREESKPVHGQSTDCPADASTDGPATVQGCHGVDREGDREGEQEDTDTLLLDVVEPARPTPRVLRNEQGFEQWWSVYPRKVGKVAAKKAYGKALGQSHHLTLLAAAVRFRDDPTRDQAFTPHPATWLNQGRWEDEGPVRPQSTALAVVRPSTTDAKVSQTLALAEKYRQMEAGA